MAENDDKRPAEKNADPERPKGEREPTRRESISRALIGAGVVTGAAVLAPVVGYLVAPVFQRAKPRWQSVGKVAEFSVGHTVKVTFHNISPVPWSGGVGRAAAWLRRASQERFIAFSINCTHLGCPVRWLPGASLFMCPCHGGVYYKNGEVAAGPPPKSLPRYPVRVKNDLVQIRTSPLPITT